MKYLILLLTLTSCPTIALNHPYQPDGDTIKLVNLSGWFDKNDSLQIDTTFYKSGSINFQFDYN